MDLSNDCALWFSHTVEYYTATKKKHSQEHQGHTMHMLVRPDREGMPWENTHTLVISFSDGQGPSPADLLRTRCESDRLALSCSA